MVKYGVAVPIHTEATVPERLPFKEIAEQVDIFEVAAYAKLNVLKNRAACPVCDSDRTIEFYPETNSFFCHTAKTGGDCISLLAHVNGYSGQYRAAKEIHEQFLGRATARPESTRPTEPAGRTTAKVQPPPAPFDPETFASKLVYSDEVEAMGISEDDAKRLGIGYHPQRKKVYFPIRNPEDASISGFVGFTGELKLPPRWARPSPNVVRLKRA